jgi:hypothetical protein
VSSKTGLREHWNARELNDAGRPDVPYMFSLAEISSPRLSLPFQPFFANPPFSDG